MIATDASYGSEYSRDFCRPLAAAAVEELDPALELVFNQRFGIFQVVRQTLVAVHYELDGFGDLLEVKRFPFWECDCLEHHQIEEEDNPYLLIHDMKAHDVKERPELMDDNAEVEAVLDYRAELEETVRDNWAHGFRFNRAQVLRIWQPFFDYTGFVR